MEAKLEKHGCAFCVYKLINTSKRSLNFVCNIKKEVGYLQVFWLEWRVEGFCVACSKTVHHKQPQSPLN
jgi:hypothetical protein